MGRSSAVKTGQTILATAVELLAIGGNKPRSPKQIADIGLEEGYLQVPRGRTRQYLNQLLQSALFNNSKYASSAMVTRTSPGRYKAKQSALALIA